MKIDKIKVFPTEVKAGVTLRNLEEYQPLGFSISETAYINKADVNSFRNLLAETLSVEPGKMKFQKQIHGDIIRYVDENSEIEESDGMITDKPGIVLNISIADCCAILIYDTKQKIIAAIHSGWRGTQKNISFKAVKKLVDEFNSDTADIICYLSACASGENYEVEEDVAQFFPSSIKAIPGDKFLFDNKKEIREQLLSAGVQDENIVVSDVCTISDENYHSYRRDKEKSGRMSAFIYMSEK